MVSSVRPARVVLLRLVVLATILVLVLPALGAAAVSAVVNTVDVYPTNVAQLTAQPSPSDECPPIDQTDAVPKQSQDALEREHQGKYPMTPPVIRPFEDTLTPQSDATTTTGDELTGFGKNNTESSDQIFRPARRPIKEETLNPLTNPAESQEVGHSGTENGKCPLTSGNSSRNSNGQITPKTEPCADCYTLTLLKLFKRDWPPLLSEITLNVRHISATSGDETPHTITCRRDSDPYLWQCNPPLTIRIDDKLLIEEELVEGWRLEPNPTLVYFDKDFTQEFCREKERTCFYTIVNVANTSDIANHKFSVQIVKEWRGAAPPDRADVLITVTTPWQSVICSWQDGTLVAAGGGPCEVGAAGTMEIEITERVLEGWMPVDPIVVTPAEILEMGACTTKDDYHYECTITIVNQAVPSPGDGTGGTGGAGGGTGGSGGGTGSSGGTGGSSGSTSVTGGTEGSTGGRAPTAPSTSSVPASEAASPSTDTQLAGSSEALALQQPATDVSPASSATSTMPPLPQVLPRTGQPQALTSLAGIGLVLLGCGVILLRRPARAR